MRLVSPGGLGFVGLLIAGANQVFDSLSGVFALALLKFGNPGGDRVHDITGSFADGLCFTPSAVYAFSAFDNLNFFL